MTRRRFFVPLEEIHGGIARLSSDQVHHLRDVLRLRIGETVEIFDGQGNGYIGRVAAEGSRFVVRSLEKLQAASEPPIDIVLALGLTKSASFEWTLQKTTELGVHDIVPLMTRFSGVRIPESKVKHKLERWRRIVQESAKQCGRFLVPRIHAPREFAKFIAGDEFSDSAKFFFYEKGRRCWNAEQDSAKRAVICIGPEGGWDGDEVATAERAGYRIFRLGPRILRAETAAVAAVAIFQFSYGDLGETT